MVTFLIRFVSLFTVALWVGGGAVLTFVVAPVVFGQSSSRKVAGDLVGSILRRFDRYVLAAGPIALLAAVAEVAGTPGAGRTLTLKLALVAAMWGLALYSRFALTPEIRRVRQELGDDLDRVPPEDPKRRMFGRLHGLSVLCLMGEILLGAFVLALAVMTPSSPVP